jgi:hypothetical protein
VSADKYLGEVEARAQQARVSGPNDSFGLACALADDTDRLVKRIAELEAENEKQGKMLESDGHILRSHREELNRTLGYNYPDSCESVDAACKELIELAAEVRRQSKRIAELEAAGSSMANVLRSYDKVLPGPGIGNIPRSFVREWEAALRAKEGE